MPMTKEEAKLVAEELLALQQANEAEGEGTDDETSDIPVAKVGTSETDKRMAKWVRDQGMELVKCKTRDQRRALLTYIGDTIDGLVGIEKAAASIENGANRRTSRVDRQLNTPYQQAFNTLQAVFGD